jgi:hypothetical protein
MPRVGPKPLVTLGVLMVADRQALTGLALAHGYDAAFRWTAWPASGHRIDRT